MKRILYLATINMNLKSGGSLACLAYYRCLCKLYPDKVDLAMCEEGCKEEFKSAIPIPQRNIVKSLLSGSIHRNKSFIDQYLKVNHTKYGLCVINVSINAGDVMDMLHSYGIKIMVIHHNFEKEYFMTNKHILTLKGHFPYLISKNEGNAYRKADINCFLTPSDMSMLEKEYGHTNAKNYLLGICEPQPRVFSYKNINYNNTIAITGSLCSYQTYHGINIFEKQYFQNMIQEFPNLKLIIAGRNPHQSIIDFQKKYPTTISLISNPESMDEIIDRASIFLCPTCTGGGLKLRLMDGLRRGLPILTHEISARGYEQFQSCPFFKTYHNVETFLDGLSTIIDFVQNDNNKFKEEILSKYKNIFSFEAGVNRMNNILSSLF